MAPRLKNDGVEAFEGREILGESVSIVGAGDGLSEALAIERANLHIGDTGYVLLEFTATAVTFKPVKDTQGLRREVKLKAGTTTIVDKELAAEHIDAQAERNRIARDLKSGKLRLDFEGNPVPNDDDPAHDAEIVIGDDGQPV
jgi:hypothetical protein